MKGSNMDAKQYDAWSRYYDPQGIEIIQINKCLKDSLGFDSPWHDARVLEVGCGTGRFTKILIDEVAHIDAFDPCEDRISILNDYLVKSQKQDKCTTFVGDLRFFLSAKDNSDKYNVIVLSWSWAYIPDSDKAWTLETLLDMLSDDGVIISTMVEAGQFENIIFDLCSKKDKCFPNDLDRNENANKEMRKLLLEKNVYIAETPIITYFEFDDLAIAAKVIADSVPGVVISEKEIMSYIYDKKILDKFDSPKVIITDIVRCFCIKKIPKGKKKAKITFNYKLCDNRGECSAAKECRKYRSAIVRIGDDERWDVHTLRCEPELCGKKCVAVCDLFSVHRFWPEVFEKIREIEKTQMEPGFLDNDRFGSGSYNPDHRTKELAEARSCLDPTKEIQILEISDGDRHASSFDSVLITDLISQSFYDRYFTKYDIPRTTEETTERIALYESDPEHDRQCRETMELFGLDELPALLIISHGKIVYKYQGFVRAVDEKTVTGLREDITKILRQLTGEI